MAILIMVPREKTNTYKKPFKGILIFTAGTLFGLFVIQWFVYLLPGPKISFIVSGYTANTAQTAGCIFYSVEFMSDSPIEYVYFKIQLPNAIQNYRVVMPFEFELPDSTRTRIQIFACGKDDKGECTIRPSTFDNMLSVQAYATGNMITVQASKLSKNTSIMGMIATDEKKTNIKPNPKLYVEGNYEYVKLGQTVRKAIIYTYTGIKNKE